MVKALAEFGDRQWVQALAAVLLGLMLAGGAAGRVGPAGIVGPLGPVAERIGQAGCLVLGALSPGAAAIMPAHHGPRG